MSNTKHIQIELDEETQERLINAFNNIPKKQEYLLDDGGAFAWMNHFDVESSDEEISVSYQPLHSAISYNGQEYVIPLDCEFYEIVFELEHQHRNKGFKIYNFEEYLQADGINILPIDNYVMVGPNVQIDDILKKLEISSDKEYNMTVEEYINSKYKEVLPLLGEDYLHTDYKLGYVYELDNIEFKIIEVFGFDLGAVLVKVK